jgi:hypothetical protein
MDPDCNLGGGALCNEYYKTTRFAETRQISRQVSVDLLLSVTFTGFDKHNGLLKKFVYS